MSYMDIDNLYKNQDILLFRECYALEKVHGTSAHISWSADGGVRLSSGGTSHETFAALFDVADLQRRFEAVGASPIIVYGEAYGGKCQGMSETYGKELRFIAFEVKIGDVFLDVPKAEDVVYRGLGLEFVPYERVAATVEALDACRDKPSVVSTWRVNTGPHPREGIVIRPLIELRKNNGERVIAKHKSDAFAERQHVPKVSKEAPEVLAEAQAIADEWVTPMRLTHVLDGLGNPMEMERTGEVIKAMVEDVLREAAGEIVDSKPARKAIGKAAAELYKQRVRQVLATPAAQANT